MTTNSNRYRYLNGNGEHVHLLDDKPLVGTSSVSKVLAKPLTWWASGLAVQAFGCPDPKVLTRIRNRRATAAEKEAHMEALAVALKYVQTLDVDGYAKLIDTAYRAHATTLKDKASAGTDLHAECERFVKAHMAGTQQDTYLTVAMYPQQIHPFIEWTHQNVKRFLWSEGHCYSEKHWIGGISDTGYEKRDGTFGILDFKSSKEAYMEQFWQTAGYGIQIAENGVLDKDGNLLYKLEQPIAEFCIFPFGGEKPQPYFNVDVAGGREAFLAELLLYNKMPRD